MYLDVGKNSELIEVSHEYKLIIESNEYCDVCTNVSSIFSDGDIHPLIPDLEAAVQMCY